jgi:hypothetical protein
MLNSLFLLLFSVYLDVPPLLRKQLIQLAGGSAALNSVSVSLLLLLVTALVTRNQL